MGVRRIISCPGGSWLLGAGTEYTSVLVPSAWADDQGDAEVRWLAASYFRGLHIVLDTAPGVGSAWTFTILVGGVETDASITISDTDTEASLADALFAFAGAESLVTLRRSPTGTPAGAAIIDYGLLVDGVESNISVYGGAPGGASQAAHLLNPAAWYGSILLYSGDILPVQFTLEKWAVHLGTAPGVGNSRTFTLWASAGLEDPLEETAIVITISDDEVDGSISPDETYPAGARFLVIATDTGSPAVSGASWCVRGRIAGDDGQSIFGSSTNPVIIHNGTGWYYPTGSIVQTVAEANSSTTVRAAFTLRNMYVHLLDGTFAGTEWFFTARRNFSDTDVVVNIEGSVLTVNTGFIEGVEAAFAAGDTFGMQVSNGGVDTDSGEVGKWAWIMVAISEPEFGIIGPLLMVDWPRREPDGTIRRDVWSDLDMHCPEDYYGGYKEGRVLFAGDAERSLSDPFTGDWTGSTFRFSQADTDGRVRAQLASPEGRYWSRPVVSRMTSRENRANLGQWYTIFAGPIIDAQPVNPLAWDVTLGDAVSHGALSDRLQIPWRLVRDGFLDQLTAVSERLDLEQAEPIIYGTHNRETPTEGESQEGSPEGTTGYRVSPIYLGIENIDGDEAHVWMVAGHACKSVALYMDGVLQTEAVGWLIPGESNWNALFANTYIDKVSSTYGDTRRYTLIYGYVGGDLESWFKQRTSIPSRCAVGDRVLTVAVEGIEDEGDGTGDLITDGFQQYEHFLINYVANQGPDSYQSGSWLNNPIYDLSDLAVTVVNETSFTDASTIANERWGGYIGAAVIGGRAGDRSGARRWIADWNRSFGCQFGINHFGQMCVVLLHPTDAIRAAAPLYTDNYEIMQGTFGTHIDWEGQATTIPFRADFEPITAQWKTNGTVSDTLAITRYERDIHAAIREYPFSPGFVQAEHLATIELRARTYVQRRIRLEVPIGPDGADRSSPAYLDLGDYFRYIHYDMVAETREERLAQAYRHQVSGSRRVVMIEGLDCEDLIGYDLDGSPGGEWGSPGAGSPEGSP